jgi:hypothetical protein
LPAALPAITSADDCYHLLESLDLLGVSRAFLLEEFGPLGLSSAALNRLAKAVSQRLEAKGLSVADCLGL